MKTGKLFVMLAAMFAVALLPGCSMDDGNEFTIDPVERVRYYVLCEGQYPSGAGAVSAVWSDGRVVSDMFSATNDRPIGNIPQSMVEFKGKYYITISGSGKIEVVDTLGLTQHRTITKPSSVEHFSPYGICFVNDNMALVSDLANNTVWVLDPASGVITGGVGVGNPGYNMVVAGGKVFVGCSIYDMDLEASINSLEYIEIADLADPATATSTVVENVKPPYGSGMFMDSTGKLWMLDENGLVCIDPATAGVTKTIEVALSWNSKLDMRDDCLYVNDASNNVYKVPVGATALPASPMFTLPGYVSPDDPGVSVYGLKVSREGNIIVCDPLSYSESGYVYEYSPAGTQVHRFTAGVVPGTIYVK